MTHNSNQPGTALRHLRGESCVVVGRCGAGSTIAAVYDIVTWGEEVNWNKYY